MNKILTTMLYGGAALVIAGCGGGNTSSSVTAAASEDVYKVATTAAASQDVPQYETYSSTVEANVTNNVAPQSSSRIQAIYVEVGDYVSKGQVLAEMDKVSLVQAELKMKNDSTEFSRIEQLYAEGGVSKSDYEAMELSYKVSRTSYQNLLENTVLRAPVSGVITSRNYDRGDMYSMGSPIYVLQQITPVKVKVGVSETDYTRVHKGDQVEITADAIPGKTFSGRVNRIYPTIDPTSHTFTVEIIVPNTDREIRPGMYVNVKVTFGVNHSIVVPDEAIVKQQGSGQRMVYLVQADGTAKCVIVTIGRHFGTSYEILGGLNEGDVVVTRGSSSLKDGVKVQVVDK